MQNSCPNSKAQAEQSLPQPAMDVGLPRLEPVLLQLRRQLQRRHRRLRRVPARQHLLTLAATATGPHVPPRERPRVSHHLACLSLLLLPPSNSRVLFFQHRSKPHKQVHSGAEIFWNKQGDHLRRSGEGPAVFSLLTMRHRYPLCSPGMCISCGNSGRKRELCLSQLDSFETEMFRGYQEREECRAPFGGSRAAAGQVALAARNKTRVFSVSTEASPKSVFFL